MKKYILFCTVLFATHSAHAENKPFEFEFAPGFGYSTYRGLIWNQDMSARYTLSDHWQLTANLGYSYQEKGSASARASNTFKIGTGVRYNFSEDQSRSYYVGTGAAYGDFFRDSWSNFDGGKRFWAYAEVGKRFRINESGTWTWSPNVTFHVPGGDGGGIGVIQPLAFSYSF